MSARGARGRTIISFTAFLIAASGTAFAQSPVISSTNPTFAQHYSIIQDAGPTYVFGQNNAPTNGWYIYADAVADFLGRGTPQILLGGFAVSGTTWLQAPVRLLVNTGSGTFADGAASIAPSSPTPAFTGAFATGDFNGDGTPDAYVANSGADQAPYSGEPNNLLLSATDGLLKNVSSELPTDVVYTQGVAAGALNGGSVLDIVVITGCCGDTPYLLINDGKGDFVKNTSRLPQELQEGTNTYQGVALVDVNNDGFADLVLGAESALHAVNKVYLNDGTGSFANSAPIELPPGCFDGPAGNFTGVLSITAADLRGTGQQDLILNEIQPGVSASERASNSYNASCIQILINDGTGHFTDQTALRGGNAIPPSATASLSWYDWTFVVDVNGDGYPDLVLAPGGVLPQTPNLVLLNDGNGFFTSTPPDFFPLFSGSSGQVPYMIPVDLNGHGKIGFVQPYHIAGQSGETLLKFAVYQPTVPLATPPPSPTLVPVTITSSPSGGSFTVTGTGCASGAYQMPANLLWSPNANCTLAFDALYLQDPRLGGTFVGNQRYTFASTMIGGMTNSANPQIVNAGTAPLAISAAFIAAPLMPPVQNSVLEFNGTNQIAFTQSQSVSVGPNFTMEAWVSPAAAGGMIMGKPNNPAT